MAVHTDDPRWQGWRRLRSFQNLFGRLSAVCMFLAALALFDGLQGIMRTGTEQIDLIPGESEAVSGSCPFKNPVVSDVHVNLRTAEAPLRFALEGFFVGYWVGNGLWRGQVVADAGTPPGTWRMRVNFRGASMPPGVGEYAVRVFSDAAERQAASPSFIRRYFGVNAFWPFAVLLGAGVALGLATYLFGRRIFRILARMSLCEIFRTSPAGAAPFMVWCVALNGSWLRPGDRFPVYSPEGERTGRAVIRGMEKMTVQLEMEEGEAAVGCLVDLEPNG